MTYLLLLRRRRDAQTLVFFLLSFGTIILLCGLAIDSGLLYLAKARLSRAVDGAALVAVGNFSETPDQVATSMRDFAVANFTSLETIASSPSATSSNTITTAAGSSTTLTYWYDDATAGSDTKGYRKYVEVVLTTGSGGQVTSATCNARCPAQTYFIGFAKGAFPVLGDLNVSSAAVATRTPRLIMVVLDRSNSMLQPPNDQGSYGAFGLPQSVITFLDFFVPGSDYIGIVSFGSSARLEMAPTTNFLNAATNNLVDSYAVASNAGIGAAEYGEIYGVPGIDPEMEPTNGDYDPNYATTGVRRLKFGGTTAADDGIRMALECMMSNSGFNNPDVIKYMVIFTDGQWNNTRTLFTAPTYTNVMICATNPALSGPVQFVTNTTPNLSDNLSNAAGVAFMPFMSPMPGYTNALNDLEFDPAVYPDSLTNHYYDYWISLDTNNGGGGNHQLEPLPGSQTTATGPSAGSPQTFVTNTYLGLYKGTNVYSTSINVWLEPGAVDYYYPAGSATATAAYIGDCNNPTNCVNIQMHYGDSNVLVVPGYIVDGFFYDGLDLPYVSPWNSGDTWPGYRWDNYNEAFMWPDDQTPLPTAADGGNTPFWFDPATQRLSFMRSLLFRNYANMLTGFYVTRADDPLGAGVEPLDTSSTWPSGSPRPLNGLGAYYPSGAAYWPFDLVAIDWDAASSLSNALVDPDVTENGMDRNNAYTINMLSTNADPEWAGQLFYMETGTNGQLSAASASSQVMSSISDWTQGAPGWISAYTSDMTSDTANSILAASVTNATSPFPPVTWRPNTFRGTIIGATNSTTTPAELLSLLQSTNSTTGGYVVDSTTGNVYANTMCWNGRPTHYYDFSKSSWVSVQDNHNENVQATPLGFWKAQEYAWHARAAGVTIYTVGYGAQVGNYQNTILAQVANATNVNLSDGTASNITYISSQPIGAQYYADSTNAISNDFYQIGQAINAALTQ